MAVSAALLLSAAKLALMIACVEGRGKLGSDMGLEDAPVHRGINDVARAATKVWVVQCG